jgi:hypothetical protein
MSVQGTATPEELAHKAEEAAQKAEKAAERAEKAAVQPRYWLIGGLSLGLVGAVLTFALRDSGASVLGVELQPFGGVLFATGVLLVVGAAIASMSAAGGTGESSTIKSVSGLIAVGIGIVAVTALTIVTLTQLGAEQKDSIVAVTTSAFGIISAVVGAYLGIKVSGEQSSNVAAGAQREAHVAQQAAQVANSKLQAVTEKADELDLDPHQTAELKAAGFEAGVEAARTPGPPTGGGGA